VIFYRLGFKILVCSLVLIFASHCTPPTHALFIHPTQVYAVVQLLPEDLSSPLSPPHAATTTTSADTAAAASQAARDSSLPSSPLSSLPPVAVATPKVRTLDAHVTEPCRIDHGTIDNIRACKIRSIRICREWMICNLSSYVFTCAHIAISL